MAETVDVLNLRLTAEDAARLKRLRERLQDAAPFVKVSKSDAMRHALRSTCSAEEVSVDLSPKAKPGDVG